MDQSPLEPQDEGLPLSPSLPPLRLWMQPTGVMIELTEADTLVGRHSTASLRLPTPDVSRRHCRIICTGGYWQIVDLDSLNGVFVNEERIVDQAELQDGDQVRIGGFTFAVELPRQGILRKDLARRLFPDRPSRIFPTPHRRAS
jgi:pSer/pThr/pTyr-binding forkhead associated (FHA) protein